MLDVEVHHMLALDGPRRASGHDLLSTRPAEGQGVAGSRGSGPGEGEEDGRHVLGRTRATMRERAKHEQRTVVRD